MKLRKPAPDPPRPRILPGPGTSLGPGLASRVRAGPELGACSGPWVRRRPHHRARAGPRPGAGTLIRVGLACGGRVRPGPRAPAGASPGQIPAGVRTPPRPSSAPPHRSCRGSGPAGAGGGATWTRDDPRGVRTRSVRVGPGAAVAGADRAQGECGPGKVVQRAHGGALLCGPLAFRWTTAVRPSFSGAECAPRRPGRGGAGRRGPRDRRVTAEHVT